MQGVGTDANATMCVHTNATIQLFHQEQADKLYGCGFEMSYETCTQEVLAITQLAGCTHCRRELPQYVTRSVDFCAPIQNATECNTAPSPCDTLAHGPIAASNDRLALRLGLGVSAAVVALLLSIACAAAYVRRRRKSQVRCSNKTSSKRLPTAGAVWADLCNTHASNRKASLQLHSTDGEAPFTGATTTDGTTTGNPTFEGRGCKEQLTIALDNAARSQEMFARRYYLTRERKCGGQAIVVFARDFRSCNMSQYAIKCARCPEPVCANDNSTSCGVLVSDDARTSCLHAKISSEFSMLQSKPHH